MKTLSNHILNFIEMNKSLITIFTLAIIISYGMSCTAQDDNGTITIIESEKYKPCCGTPSEVSREIIPGINIFIPNVFTPNGDGINDLFYPVVDTSLVPNGSVYNFTIYNSNDDKIKRIVFSRDWINYLDIKNYGFDGQYFDSDKNVRKKWDGQFWYQFSINIDGKGQFDFRGSVCSIVCDEESAIFRDKKGCFFPAQVTKDKKGDNKLSNKETDCFK